MPGRLVQRTEIGRGKLAKTACNLVLESVPDGAPPSVHCISAYVHSLFALILFAVISGSSVSVLDSYLCSSLLSLLRYFRWLRLC